MEEILHQLIDGLSRYLQGFNHPRWCKISQPSTVGKGMWSRLIQQPIKWQMCHVVVAWG